MGFYGDQVLPRVIDKVCGVGEIHKHRARVVEGLEGEVVEIGFGSGLNVSHLPEGVTQLLAVDPAVVGRRLAEPRIAERGVEVTFVGLDGEHLPLPDRSVDHALCTFTLCTIPDAHRALEEVRRVLRPGGRLHFLEHGLSPEPSVATWQHRLTPAWRLVAGGCHLDRRVDELLTDGGFEIESLENGYLKGFKPAGYLYEGVARAA
jgi:ubiquinone/menaquinone biosynthesis C-methylase UbiE